MQALAGVPGWLKVGAELYAAAGPLAPERVGKHGRVFLDIKLHDIPNTVRAAVAAAARHRASMLTVHAGGGAAMLRAARAGAQEAAAAGASPPLLVAVTVLTSLDEAELARVGVGGPVRDQVLRLADLALDCGLDGVVASPREAALLRERLGPEAWIVTPGIRPAGAEPGDQARAATPAEAVAAGSDLLVVGRPVVRAGDPAAAARRVVAEIEQALGAAS